MKVTSVEIHPEGSSEIAVLSFRDPGRTNPYNVIGIDGLTPNEIVPKFYKGSGSVKFYDLVVEKRDVVILAQMNPRPDEGESYSSLRDDLYRMIQSSRTGKVQLKFKNGSEIVAVLTGTISKLEASIFDAEPAGQITLTCDDPMLKAPTPTEIDLVGLDPADTNIQDDISTAKHGFKFELEVVSGITSFIMEPSGDSTWKFRVALYGFLAGDIIHFSSEYNNKYFYLMRGSTKIHLANVIAPGSVWPILFPGNNIFEITNPSSFEWVSITHYPTYWGV